MRQGLRAIVLAVLAAALPVVLPIRTALAATAYHVTMTKVQDSTLGDALQGSSTLIELQKSPPDDITTLRRRAVDDLTRLRKALRSAGYYDGDVAITVDGQPVAESAPMDSAETGSGKKKKVVPVKITITPGKLYKLRNVVIKSTDGGNEAVLQKLKPTLKSGAPARAGDIIAERRRLLDQVMGLGYPFALVDLKPAVVDHASDTLDVTFTMDPGQHATLGKVTVKGLDYVDPGFIAKRTALPKEKAYSPAALDALRDDLRSLDVFSSVKVTPGTALDDQGRLPVEVDVAEQDRHFIGFGASYSTNDGAGGTAYWGDRNLFGGAERLRIEGDVTGIDQDSALGGADYTLTTNFTSPDFLDRRQDFLSNLAITDEHDPDTFDKKAVTFTAGVQRHITDHLTVNAGWEIEASQIDDNDGTSDFLLDGPTASVKYDTTDDLLNPTKGLRLETGGEALPTWLGSNENVFTTKSSASSYLDILGNGNLVLAGRVSFSNAFGSSLEGLPADRRLYAGGGGTVRGYQYRSISPEDSNGDLTGGRSEVDGSIELRYRFLGNFGIVPFLDAGTVSRRAFPDFSEAVQYAGGIGFRYYTSFGPIRADIAVPLNPRKDDDPVAFYVSIGQSF
ncbi:MAG TPA: autotransporter assembly complex family protein [Dongiaceae bacterium]